MQKFYAHWTDVPETEWLWPNFSPEEMACRGTGELLVDYRSMDMLQALRDDLGKPVIVNSAYRSEAHNRSVGGAKNSQHLLAKAFDPSMQNHNPAEFEAAARAIGFKGIGHYPLPHHNFMHIDTRATEAKWNKGGWFPDQAEINKTNTPNFKAEPKAETLVTTLLKPGVLTAAGGAITSVGAVSQGSGPVQWALGLGLGVFVAFGAIIVVRQFLQSKPGD